MGHVVPIKSREQYAEAIRVLNKVEGTWQGVGPSSDRRLLLTEKQYIALVEAGVISRNDMEVKNGGKKKTGKKAKS